MVEALTLQKSGYSTPRCSKTVSWVFQLVWTTSRRSQLSSSYGCTPSVLKMRSIFKTLRRAWVLLADPLAVSVIRRSPCSRSSAGVVVQVLRMVLAVLGHACVGRPEGSGFPTTPLRAVLGQPVG